MVLVDTSVWIRFLANRTPVSSKLDALLADGEVCGHEFIFGELLMGASGERQTLLHAYSDMHQVPTVPHREVVQFARTRRLYGRGIGWIDTHLLASALVARTLLWTADNRLAGVARELGISFE
jgi:predicted nucleic acid-binding protein